MQLNYRGVNYESNSPILGVRNSNPADATLTYRGNDYDTNLPVAARTEAVEVIEFSLTEPVSASVATSSNDRARALMMNHHRQVKQRQQVMLARLATSIGLNANETTQYWNHIQGKVHPSFWATYDRSRAASS